MSGVFAGNQWTTASGSNWNVVIGPSFLTEVAELSNHLALASQDARTASEKIVESAEEASEDKSAQQKVVDNLLDQIAETGVNQGAEARDIEGFANQFAGLVKLVFTDEAARTDRIQRLAAAIARGSSQTTAAGSRSRYAALSALLNSLPDSAPAPLRISIFSSLVQAACNRNELPIIRPALSALPRWLKQEWQVQSTSQADEVVTTVVTSLEKVQAGEDIRRLLLAYVDANSADALKEKLLIYSLASDAQDAYEIESLPSPSQNQQLAQLRDIFLGGSLQDLQSASSASELPKPLNAQKLQDKLRYVILSDYCFTRVGQTATYAEVAQAISLEQSGDEDEQAMEVESWIIATIRAKLLTARLHQPSSTISILRASPRRFSDAHWQTLSSRLENWKSSISSIQEVVGRAIGPAPGSQRRDAREDNFNAQAVTTAAREIDSEAGIEVA